MTDCFFSLCYCPPLPTNSMLVNACADAWNVVNLRSFLPASEIQKNFACASARGSWSASSI